MKDIEYNIICTKDNMDSEFKFLEMCMNSLFDHSYAPEERVIIASNKNIEVKLTKKKSSTTMEIVRVTIQKPEEKFSIRKVGNFELYINNYKKLGVDNFIFENNV